MTAAKAIYIWKNPGTGVELLWGIPVNNLSMAKPTSTMLVAAIISLIMLKSPVAELAISFGDELIAALREGDHTNAAPMPSSRSARVMTVLVDDAVSSPRDTKARVRSMSPAATGIFEP